MGKLRKSFGRESVESVDVLERGDGDVHLLIKRGFWEVREWFESYYAYKGYAKGCETPSRFSTVAFFEGEKGSAFVNITPCPCNKKEVLVTASELAYR